MKRLPLVLLLALLPPAYAETPEQVQQRLQDYRQRVLDTKLYVEEKKRREYEETWKSYGKTEINRKNWRREKDGSWVTEAKFRFAPRPDETAEPLPSSPTPLRLWAVRPPKRFQDSLEDLVREGVIKPSEACLVGRCGLEIQKIAVTCSSLMVSGFEYGRWLSWYRPSPGDPLESLIVDRCSVPPNL